MLITNTHQIEGQSFEDYLAIPRLSFSGIKSEGKTITQTPKMELGTMVHNYLLEPQRYNYQRFEEVKPIANHLRDVLGTALQYAKPELTVLADFKNEGMLLEYKGRVDLKLSDLIIDLKVSDAPLKSGIEYFRYDRQLTGYALAAKADKAMIISYNKKKKKVEMQMITFDIDYWKLITLKYGKRNENRN
jgi:hypothetical protein